MPMLPRWLRSRDAAADDAESQSDCPPVLLNAPVVQMHNIHKTYLLGLEGVPALRGVSVSIQRGEWVVIYGTSGGGKTSLLNLVGTIDKPTKGEMRVCDTVINANTTDEELALLRLHSLGFVFQTFNLLSSMTARENVELPMTLKGTYSAKQRAELATASLQRVGMGHRVDHFPSQLSGGEQQRVTIARAIANRPDLLLLDEPTGDLDSANTYKVIDLLHRLNCEQHMTLLMVTHDVYLKNFAHRIIFMRDGKVAREEIIPEERRQAALADLYRKMNEARLSQARRHTEIRSPRDYPTYSPRAHTRNVVGIPGKQPSSAKLQSQSKSKLNISHSSLRQSASAKLKQLLHLEPNIAGNSEDSEHLPITKSKSAIALESMAQKSGQILSSSALDDV
ncbi:ABC transporter H member 2 [Sorochytrium milnesiophthora]